MSQYLRIWQPLTVKWRLIIVYFKDVIVCWVQLKDTRLDHSMFCDHHREIPLYSLSKAGTHWYSENHLL